MIASDREKLVHIAERMPEVYESGQKSEYDRFWDIFQDNGNRTHYSYGFGGRGWTEETFKPKYDITPTESPSLFYASGNFDLVKALDEAGVKLDLSKSINVNALFAWAQITHIGEIDITAAREDATNNMFSSCSDLTSIDKLILRSDGSQSFGTGPFTGCAALKNITIEGIIGNSISFQYSPLTTASMKSIITHLANYEGTDNEGTCTVTFSDACWTALEADSAAPDGGTWKSYVNDVLGWLT